MNANALAAVLPFRQAGAFRYVTTRGKPNHPCRPAARLRRSTPSCSAASPAGALCLVPGKPTDRHDRERVPRSAPLHQTVRSPVVAALHGLLLSVFFFFLLSIQIALLTLTPSPKKTQTNKQKNIEKLIVHVKLQIHGSLLSFYFENIKHCCSSALLHMVTRVSPH